MFISLFKLKLNSIFLIVSTRFENKNGNGKAQQSQKQQTFTVSNQIEPQPGIIAIDQVLLILKAKENVT